MCISFNLHVRSEYALRVFGDVQVGIFVNSPATKVQDEDSAIIVDYWRGHRQSQTVSLFSPDGTIECKDRLKTGKDCLDPKVICELSDVDQVLTG